MMSRDNQPKGNALGDRQAIDLAIDIVDFSGLWGPDKVYQRKIDVADAIVAALKEKSVGANVVPGGVNFSVKDETVLGAAQALATFGIDIRTLKNKTFRQQLDDAGSLQKLFTQDPLGMAGQIMKQISGERN